MTSSPASDVQSEAPPPERRVSLPVRLFRFVENAVVVFTLAAMVLMPLLEALFRELGWSGISGSPQFVQHGSLILGLIGGAIAARHGRLLSMATAEFLPKGWPTGVAKVFSGTVAAVISGVLCIASIQYVVEEYRSIGELAYGIRPWMLEMAMPIGFSLIAVRIVLHAGRTWRGKTVAGVLAAALLGFFVLTNPRFWRWTADNLEDWVAWTRDARPGWLWSWVSDGLPGWLEGLRKIVPTILPETLFWPALGVLLGSIFLGGPIFVMLGGAAVVLFWGDQDTLASLPIDHYRLVINPQLPALALFTLVGYVLAQGGASKRLVRVFMAWFGWTRGGPAVVTILVCAFFTSFTGASGVTILALGGLLLPALQTAGYGERRALGLLTGAGSLGMLLPPCLPLILYSVIASQQEMDVRVENMFLAAIGPGVVLLAVTGAVGWWMGPSRGQYKRPAFNLREGLAALWGAKWELLLPVLCLTVIFKGWMTVVEAAALTALYAVLSQTLLSRDLKIFRDVPRVFVETALVIGGVLLILGVAQMLTNWLVKKELFIDDDYLPLVDYLVNWVTTAVKSPLLFLLLLNAFLLVVGCLMDVYSAIIVILPLLAPIAMRYNIHPLHLGVIFLANLELGFLTPPVGMNLFLASYRFNRPMLEICRAILPILLVQLTGVLLITYVPQIALLLPQWLGT